jgi:peptide/nickel transport system permease protein
VALRGYLIRRLAVSIPQLLLVSVLAFCLLHLAPGDPVLFYLGDPNLAARDPMLVAQVRADLGLDKPLWDQYLMWLQKLMNGDFGYSYISRRPVAQMILEVLPNTLLLMSSTIVLSVAIGIPLGVICATRRNSFVDRFIQGMSVVGLSSPVFWMGLMFILLFSVQMRWFPSSGVVTLGEGGPSTYLADVAWHMTLPLSVLVLRSMTVYVRLTRSTMLEVLGQDYVRTGRAKGLPEHKVLYKHALRNAFLPIVTVIGLNVGLILNGAVITETVFAWPGLGRLAVQSVTTRDYSVTLAIIMVVGFMVVICNLVTDVVYSVLDPKIKY